MPCAGGSRPLEREPRGGAARGHARGRRPRHTRPACTVPSSAAPQRCPPSGRCHASRRRRATRPPPPPREATPLKRSACNLHRRGRRAGSARARSSEAFATYRFGSSGTRRRGDPVRRVRRPGRPRRERTRSDTELSALMRPRPEERATDGTPNTGTSNRLQRVRACGPSSRVTITGPRSLRPRLPGRPRPFPRAAFRGRANERRTDGRRRRDEHRFA